jgi:hypothetical protein
MDLLAGAADLHVHSSPDIDERRYDDIDLAREAAKAGMGAILIKSHQNSTVERAYLVSKIVPEISVFGGLVLNESVGGLNPAAVRVALRLGAKEIWMPTRSARNHRQHEMQPGGITIFDGDGNLLPVVEEILSAVAQSDCILSTGHLSPIEGTALLRRAHGLGIRKLLVTHPEWAPTFYPFELQQELASLGVFFERCFVSTTHRCGFTPFETIEQAIDELGWNSTILATDLGQVDTPSPVDGMRLYVERLLSTGFTRDAMRQMLVSNPARLLASAKSGVTP